MRRFDEYRGAIWQNFRALGTIATESRIQSNGQSNPELERLKNHGQKRRTKESKRFETARFVSRFYVSDDRIVTNVVTNEDVV